MRFTEIDRGTFLLCLASLGTFSVFVITILMIPLSKQASSWNVCVDATKSHLRTNGFQASAKETEATAVVLCNGSSIPASRQNKE